MPAIALGADCEILKCVCCGECQSHFSHEEEPSTRFILHDQTIREKGSKKLLSDHQIQTTENKIQGQEQPKPSYVKDFNRVARAAEARAKLEGSPPTIISIAGQMALRASVMKIATLRREITGLRKTVNHYLDTEQWPELTEDIPWVRKASLEEISWLSSTLDKSASEWVDLGKKFAPQRVKALINANFPGAESDALQALSGVFQERSRSASRDTSKTHTISEKDLRDLDFTLGDYPHKEALATLNKNRVNAGALLRIFMRTISLTGMRPTEVFDCTIMVGDPDRQYTPFEIGQIQNKPYTSIENGLLKSIDLIQPSLYGGLAKMVQSISETTRVPPILVIKNAKRTNSNSDLTQPYRVQIISGMEEEDLQVLCLAAHLHHFKIESTRRSNLISVMTRNLNRIAKEVLSQEKSKINLYSFRHAFATRARLSLPVWQVAALLGHTAKTSTYIYGKKQTRRRKSGSSSGGWLPGVDAEVAEKIHDVWALKDAPATDTNQVSEPENSDQDNSIENEISFSISDF
jgi:integrase